MFSPIEHPFLSITYNPYRKLELVKQGSADLYISLNSGTANRFNVIINLSSRYTNSGNTVRANSCYIKEDNSDWYSKASNLVTSSTTFSFDLDTS